MSAALAGAALQLGGSVIGAQGEAQGARALQGVWRDAMHQQNGFDDDIQAEIEAYLRDIGAIGPIDRNAVAEERSVQGNAVTSAARAVDANSRRKTGGSRGGAVARSQGKQANAGTVGRVLRDSNSQALLRALQAGGQRTAGAGQDLQRRTGVVRSDARDAARLTPLYAKRAGLEGGKLRRLGQLMQVFGQGGMNWGMSQPATNTAAIDPNLDLWAQAPQGGWATQAPNEFGDVAS